MVWVVLTVAAAVMPAAGCGQVKSAPEPDRVVVQHLLVSFRGKVPGKLVNRNQAEAKSLAHDLLVRARNGEDFAALVQKYTDDQPPGTYTMVNRGRTPAEGEYGREQMVGGFGDMAFSLEVGEIGLCPYDSEKSPYGFHLVKRLE